MKRTSFCENWICEDVETKQRVSVDVPYDAMLREERSPKGGGGVNNGWHCSHDYVFEKDFAAVLDDCAVLEFEGVYHNAEVYLNGEKIAARPNGYTNFYVDLKPYLKEENHLAVVAHNADQPNSRWYSGSGILRPVWLWTAAKEHIRLNGVRISTLSIDPPTAQINVSASCGGEIKIEISDGEEVLFSQSKTTSDGKAEFVVELDGATLWSVESPKLYSCKVSFADDETQVYFGIRQISCTKDDGFCLNGQRVVLRGCCVHSDNGLLGGCSFADAEERKVQILKNAGYNAVRSAHNPCPKSFLDACDKLGMLVMDEYTDCWYIHKTKHDYATYCAEWFERDLTDMIEKDFNHPSVIMYSLGNEVGESASKEGVEFFRKMKAVCHRLDASRAVTCGINILFNLMCSMGMGIYSDEKAEKNPEKEVGSAFFNAIAGKLGAHTMKIGATLGLCDAKSKDIFAASDVAGYNYGILRYKKDLKKYPDRIIVGSETFCSDAYAFYELAKKQKRLIGDFVWAGMDYLGEVGIGSWEYKDYAPDFNHVAGWITAGSGRVDVTGKLLGEAAYTRVAFGLEDVPQIAVVPVNHTNEAHSPSAWKFTNAVQSWSWNGYDKKSAKVEVYSRADSVELFVNGKSVGKRKLKNTCRAIFKTLYRDGEVKVVAYDKDGKVCGQNTLATAREKTILSAVAEKATVKKGGLVYVRLSFTDENGTVKPLVRGKISVSVKGGKLLALGNACPFNPDGYLNDETQTYFGEALAIVRADENVTLTAQSDFGSAKVVVKVED